MTDMPAPFPRLDFAPGWQATNDNLVELVDLFDDGKLEWVPRHGEWPARVIFAHVIGARYHGPIATPDDIARLGDLLRLCRTPEGIKQELRASWEALARFLRDQKKLDDVYDAGSSASESQPTLPPPLLGSVERAMAGMDLGYVDEPVSVHRPLHRVPPLRARPAPPRDAHRLPLAARREPRRPPHPPALRRSVSIIA